MKIWKYLHKKFWAKRVKSQKIEFSGMLLEILAQSRTTHSTQHHIYKKKKTCFKLKKKKVFKNNRKFGWKWDPNNPGLTVSLLDTTYYHWQWECTVTNEIMT